MLDVRKWRAGQHRPAHAQASACGRCSLCHAMCCCPSLQTVPAEAAGAAGSEPRTFYVDVFDGGRVMSRWSAVPPCDWLPLAAPLVPRLPPAPPPPDCESSGEPTRVFCALLLLCMPCRQARAPSVASRAPSSLCTAPRSPPRCPLSETDTKPCLLLFVPSNAQPRVWGLPAGAGHPPGSRRGRPPPAPPRRLVPHVSASCSCSREPWTARAGAASAARVRLGVSHRPCWLLPPHPPPPPTHPPTTTSASTAPPPPPVYPLQPFRCRILLHHPPRTGQPLPAAQPCTLSLAHSHPIAPQRMQVPQPAAHSQGAGQPLAYEGDRAADGGGCGRGHGCVRGEPPCSQPAAGGVAAWTRYPGTTGPAALPPPPPPLPPSAALCLRSPLSLGCRLQPRARAQLCKPVCCQRQQSPTHCACLPPCCSGGGCVPRWKPPTPAWRSTSSRRLPGCWRG